MTPVGVRIKQARNRRKLTQERLSEATNVPVRTLRRIEKGEVGDSAAITQLCDYLEIPVNEEALVTTRADPPLSQANFMECLLRLYEIHRQAVGDAPDARPPVELSTDPPPAALLDDDTAIKIEPPDGQVTGRAGAVTGP